MKGEVIGINTAIYSPSGGSVGIGFAVPSNVAKTVVAQLQSRGKVSRGWLGVQIQEVTPAIAASLGLPGEQGALVAVVTPGSPGAQAGLKQGDLDWLEFVNTTFNVAMFGHQNEIYDKAFSDYFGLKPPVREPGFPKI